MQPNRQALQFPQPQPKPAEVWQPHYQEDWRVFSIISQLQNSEDYDPKLLQQLLDIHQGFIRSIVIRYSRWGVSIEELIAAGENGLVKAVGKFEIKPKNRFTTYAYKAIHNEIKDVIAQLKFGRSRRVWDIFRKFFKLQEAALREEEFNSGDNLKLLEANRDLFNDEDYDFLSDYFQEVFSLDASSTIDGDEHHEIIPGCEDVEDNVLEGLNIDQLNQKLKSLVQHHLLNEKELLVLQLSFGLISGYHIKPTDEEIGELIGLSPESLNKRKVVSAYKNSALKKLRPFFNVIRKQAFTIDATGLSELYQHGYFNETETRRILEVLTMEVNYSNYQQFAKSKSEDERIWLSILQKIAKAQDILDICAQLYEHLES